MERWGVGTRTSDDDDFALDTPERRIRRLGVRGESLGGRSDILSRRIRRYLTDLRNVFEGAGVHRRSLKLLAQKLQPLLGCGSHDGILSMLDSK